jgi:hypothetical protein
MTAKPSSSAKVTIAQAIRITFARLAASPLSINRPRPRQQAKLEARPRQQAKLEASKVNTDKPYKAHTLPCVFDTRGLRLSLPKRRKELAAKLFSKELAAKLAA